MTENEEQMEMSFRQKVEHFWEYEKWKVIIPIIVLVVIWAMVDSYRNENRELTLDIAMINAVMESPADVTFPDAYAKECNIDIEKAPIRVETGMIHPEIVDESTVTDTVAIASIQKYNGLLLSGKTDITISNTWVVAEYQKTDAYENLEELLPKELLDELQEKMFYCENQQGENVPVGIMVEDISDINKFYNRAPVLTVSKYSERKEQAVTFITWLMKQ